MNPETIIAKAERVLLNSGRIKAQEQLGEIEQSEFNQLLLDAVTCAAATLSLTAVNAKLLEALRDARNTIDLWGEYSQPIIEQLVTISQAIAEAEAMREAKATQPLPVPDAGEALHVATAMVNSSRKRAGFPEIELSELPERDRDIYLSEATAAITALDEYRRGKVIQPSSKQHPAKKE